MAIASGSAATVAISWWARMLLRFVLFATIPRVTSNFVQKTIDLQVSENPKSPQRLSVFGDSLLYFISSHYNLDGMSVGIFHDIDAFCHLVHSHPVCLVDAYDWRRRRQNSDIVSKIVIT